MNVAEIIEELLRSKKPRYITATYISKRVGASAVAEIVQLTQWLPDTVSMSERLYCIYHKIRCVTEFTGYDVKNKATLTKFNTHPYSFINSMFIGDSHYTVYGANEHPVPYNKEQLKEFVTANNITTCTRNRVCVDYMYKYIANHTSIDVSQLTGPAEAWHIITKDMPSIPVCACGSKVRYKQNGIYSTFCSRECSSKSMTTKRSRAATCIARYGTTSTLTDPTTRQKIKTTNIEKYGVDNPFKSKDIQTRIHSKRRDNDQGRISKTTKTNRILGYKQITQKLEDSSTRLLCSVDQYTGVREVQGSFYDYSFKCILCGNIFTDNFRSAVDRVRIPLCPKCFPKSQSAPEREIREFIGQFTADIETRNRRVIHPFEVDIYLPILQLAIEYNGLYWHSSKDVEAKYHLTKTEKAAEAGIRLIHIFSDEYIQHRDIVLSRLKCLTNNTSKRIYARKCSIKEVTSRDKGIFLKRCHIQGNDKSRVNLGLYHGDQLVSVMTFCPLRKALGSSPKPGHWELSRFCSELDTTVIGGASKLLKHFEREYKPVNIVSYADRRWSTGNVYKQLGFDHVSNTQPNYFYTCDFQSRQHRFNFRKQVLKDKLPEFDETKTERENMENAGFYRVYDCGHMKFEKALQS